MYTAIVAAIFSDMYDNNTRGIAITFYAMGVFMGPFMAPFSTFPTLLGLGIRLTREIHKSGGLLSPRISAGDGLSI